MINQKVDQILTLGSKLEPLNYPSLMADKIEFIASLFEYFFQKMADKDFKTIDELVRINCLVDEVITQGVMSGEPEEYSGAARNMDYLRVKRLFWVDVMSLD